MGRGGNPRNVLLGKRPAFRSDLELKQVRSAWKELAALDSADLFRADMKSLVSEMKRPGDASFQQLTGILTTIISTTQSDSERIDALIPAYKILQPYIMSAKPTDGVFSDDNNYVRINGEDIDINRISAIKELFLSQNFGYEMAIELDQEKVRTHKYYGKPHAFFPGGLEISTLKTVLKTYLEGLYGDEDYIKPIEDDKDKICVQAGPDLLRFLNTAPIYTREPN